MILAQLTVVPKQHEWSSMVHISFGGITSLKGGALAVATGEYPHTLPGDEVSQQL